MKTIVLLLLLTMRLTSMAQQTQPDFALYFGNDFANDSVTIFANGIQIAQNIRLKAVTYDPLNLVIKQYKSTMTIKPYLEKERIIKKVKSGNAQLNLDIILNNIRRSFYFDLNKGRSLFANYSELRIGWSCLRILRISQKIDGPIIF